MGRVLGEAGLVYGRPNVYRHSVDVGEAELLKSEEQVSAVQAAAEHSDDGPISAAELRKLLEAIDIPFLLQEDAVSFSTLC